MSKEKILSIFALGVLFGVFITSYSAFIKRVSAAKPVRTDSVNYFGGFYKDLNNARLTGEGNGIFLAYHDFTGFNFTDATLEGDNLTETKFTNANLLRTNFTGANLYNADFTGALNLETTQWNSCDPSAGNCPVTICPNGEPAHNSSESCLGKLGPDL